MEAGENSSGTHHVSGVNSAVRKKCNGGLASVREIRGSHWDWQLAVFLGAWGRHPLAGRRNIKVLNSTAGPPYKRRYRGMARLDRAKYGL
jgi:hypothetical protein